MDDFLPRFPRLVFILRFQSLLFLCLFVSFICSLSLFLLESFEFGSGDASPFGWGIAEGRDGSVEAGRALGQKRLANHLLRSLVIPRWRHDGRLSSSLSSPRLHQ